MNLLHDAYTAYLSGITHKTGNEIHWHDHNGDPATIEKIGEDKYILRWYYSGGRKAMETAYLKDDRHGKSIGYHIDGKKIWEMNYKNDVMHGKHIKYDVNGNKEYEAEYRNGDYYGKVICWYPGGKIKKSEMCFKNGKEASKFTKWNPDGTLHSKKDVL